MPTLDADNLSRARTSLARFHARVLEKTRDVTAAPVLIVALGDSVTQGRMAYDVLDAGAVYHARLKTLLEGAFPLATLSVVNAGVSGQTAGGARSHVERDVLRHDPDLVLIGFGLNDAALGGMAGLGEFEAALSDLARRVRQETSAGIILLTPNFTASRDNPRVHPEQRSYVELLTRLQNDGTVAAYAEVVRAVAARFAAPFADAYHLWQLRAAAGEDVDAHLCNGLNHPDAEMHAALAGDLLALILRAASGAA